MNYLLLMLSAHLALMNSIRTDLKADPTEWRSYKLNYGKNYGPEEDSLRSLIYAQSKQQVEEFNFGHNRRAGFQLGLNHLSDWAEAERKILMGYKAPKNHAELLRNSPEGEKFLERILNDRAVETIPDEVDWRKVPGRVSEVKDQGKCGSCWAFATTGVLEGQEVVRKGAGFKLVELSEQNLVDCTNNGTGRGCEGGYMSQALDLIKSMGGIDDENSYPYKAQDSYCKFNKSNVVMTDTGAVVLPTGDEQKLKEVVARFGPVSVAIDASSTQFVYYKSGVYFSEDCSNRYHDLNHGVLVVGYGTDAWEGDYWIVKNSWGSSWGDYGYLHMARNRGNNCGIATAATIPTF